MLDINSNIVSSEEKLSQEHFLEMIEIINMFVET